MKKFFVVLAPVFSCLIIMALCASCSDNDVAQPTEENLENTEPVDKTPTTDAMTTTTNAKAYVFGGKYGGIGDRIIDRLNNRQTELDGSVKLILISAEKFASLSGDELTKVCDAFGNGAKIIVDRPSPSEIKAIHETVTSDGQYETPDASTPNDEVEEVWGFNSTLDYLWVDIPVNDTIDTSAANRATLTDYQKGLFADQAVAWVNIDQVATAKARQRSVARRVDQGTDMSNLLGSQTDTWVTSVSAGREDFNNIKDKHTPYTIFTTIYAVHRSDDDTDYFLIDQTMTGNNSVFWLGEWSQKDYKAGFDDAPHNWRLQGYYANNWWLDNCITKGDWDNKVTLDDGLALVSHSPLSANESTTTSTSTSWSISGNVGNTGGSFSAGISGTVGSSQTLMDISTVDKCMADNDCHNNAWWEYVINDSRQIEENTFTFDFRTPPTAAINTFSSEQTWLWELKNASKYDDLWLKTRFQVYLYRTLVRNPFLAYSGHEGSGYSVSHLFRIKLPRPVKQ